MSGCQMYDTIQTTCSPQQVPLPSTSSMAATEWFAATPTPYPNQYLTPYSTAPLESQKWAPQVGAPLSDPNLGPYSLGSTIPLQQHYTFNPPNRPRSSPSTFGPAPESIPWQNPNALGIQYVNESMNNTGVLQPATYEQFGNMPQASAPNTPEIQQPVPRRTYANITPNPATIVTPLNLGKRYRADTPESSDLTESKVKRPKRTGSVNSAELSEDDRYLLKLKEEEGLPWKDIATRFQTDTGKCLQIAALQMRYKRLRERYRIWEDEDLQALKLAHEYWQKCKWDIISQKMAEYGNPERWSSRNCARKWQEMELMTATSIAAATAGVPAAMPQFSTSPIEAPVQYSFVPLSQQPQYGEASTSTYQLNGESG